MDKLSITQPQPGFISLECNRKRIIIVSPGANVSVISIICRLNKFLYRVELSQAASQSGYALAS